VLLIQALVLGLLQGLTEFLPVSSSGHLEGVPYLLGWDSGSLAFNVMVHAGTLVAVVWYFRVDLLELLRGALGIGEVTATARRRAWIMIALLAIASVPAAAAGLLFSDVFEAAFASPRAVALFLYLTALLLWLAERIRSRRLAGRPDVADASDGEDDLGRDVTTLRARDAVAMGAAQALAIFPGISRSGATIATGMALGLSRTAAARFSFLMAVPVILGATALTAGDLGTPEPGALPFGPLEVTVGVVAATLSGYWAIHTLLQVVQRRDLLGFARYVVVFGTVLLAATFIRA
jgi:undecaprenyl-diphosphatase